MTGSQGGSNLYPTVAAEPNRNAGQPYNDADDRKRVDEAHLIILRLFIHLTESSARKRRSHIFGQ